MADDEDMTAPLTSPPDRGVRSFPVPWPVLLVAGVMVVGLLAMSRAFGFHGDEM